MRVKILLINCFLLLAGVFIVELLFGGWVNPEGIRGLNIVRNTNFTFKVDQLYGREGEKISYKRDRLGLRGKYEAVSQIDMVTLGGSGTDQRYIDEGKTWQDVLVRNFRDEGKAITVVNAGVDGRSSRGHIKDLELWLSQIPGLTPQFILFYIGANDLFTEETNYNDDVAGNRTLKDLMRSKSALYMLYRTLVGTYRASFVYPIGHRSISFVDLTWTREALLKEHEWLTAYRVALYGKRLHLLVERVQRLGARPIFVAQAVRYFKREKGEILGVADEWNYDGVRINGVDLFYMMAGIHKKTMEVCREVGGICIDLANNLLFEEGDFYDYFHNTPSGTEKIGNFLHEQLRNFL